jgi:predicted RNA-binding protein YlxR (DUF448 family)
MSREQQLRVAIRTCVGCRGKDRRDRLLRLVVADGKLRVDVRRRLPGRGASVHPNASCLAQAARKGLVRALAGKPAALGGEELRRLALGALHEAVQGRAAWPDEMPATEAAAAVQAEGRGRQRLRTWQSWIESLATAGGSGS